jgi:transaldolase
MNSMTRIHELTALGQSIWLDYIRRSLLDDGGLQALIDQGVRGVTSNPTIFQNAIAGSHDYDEALRQLVAESHTVNEIYESLAISDIQRAADLLRPVYEESRRTDGYVSLEVSPTLAHDTAGTIAEAQRLAAAVDRPNLMIKVPATPAGIPAIRTLIGAGLSINVTLIFSLAQYEAVVEAYFAGLEDRASAGGELASIASVASFFVSRVDGLVDPALARAGASELQGKAAIANAKLAYARFRALFSGPRWEQLAAQGAQLQRPLWASTGTKDPRYPDTLYVDSLIGAHTVNTVPPATLQAFLDHGNVGATLDSGLDEARTLLAQLALYDIDLDAITQRLQDDGVAVFAKSFETLMTSIAEKREQLLARQA